MGVFCSETTGAQLETGPRHSKWWWIPSKTQKCVWKPLKMRAEPPEMLASPPQMLVKPVKMHGKPVKIPKITK